MKLNKMTRKILETISECTIYDYEALEKGFQVLGSFDKLISAYFLSITLHYDLQHVCDLLAATTKCYEED